MPVTTQPAVRLPDREFQNLYEFAAKYARVCRSPLVEVEDAIQEMMAAALTCRYKSREYVKGAMRHKYIDMIRSRKSAYAKAAVLDEAFEIPLPETSPDAKDTVERLLRAVSEKQVIVLNRLRQGYSVGEIVQLERITRMTIWRYIRKARGVLEYIDN